MRILWFSVTPITLSYDINEGANGKSWISSLLRVVLKSSELELGIAYVNDSPTIQTVEKRDTVCIYPMNIHRSKLKKKLVDAHDLSTLDQLTLEASLTVIQQFKPDIIQIFGSEWCFGLLAEKTKIPIVIHIQGFWPQYFNTNLLPGESHLKRVLNYWWRPWSMIYYFYKLNASTQRAFREEHILRINHYYMGRTHWDRSIVELYNPTAQYYFVNEALRKDFISLSTHWSPNEEHRVCTIITTGCNPHKGPDVILRTAKILKVAGLKFRWIIFGGGESSLRIYERLTGLKGKDYNIIMGGHVNSEQLIRNMLDADMYVHPAYAENSPNAICEAQYTGMPVIASNAGGTVSLFSDDYDRDYLVPINDPYYLASKIINLFNDTNKQRELGRLNRQVALRRHADDHILHELIKAYKQIINKNRSEHENFGNNCDL